MRDGCLNRKRSVHVCIYMYKYVCACIYTYMYIRVSIREILTWTYVCNDIHM